ncbi:HdeD family acid-resistance protein [Bifidobacterium phasiani]|uniref:HdeD family acid-resistance protein n=1 Tax=Bifidobacterium phasiani TaxID=2834431 RepID=A0ABS6WA06_9BIFI|nr:HdeD family acid-resistance protein [Bifidobacterium phasiani]MBW3083152.1 HdeD family acid-resistance protein [Bifidobacterium phasiani]
MTDPNTNGQDPYGQNPYGQRPEGQPQYGAYGPYAGNPQSDPQPGQRPGGDPYGANAGGQNGPQGGGQYYAYTQYTRYTAPGAPGGQPDPRHPYDPFKLFEEMLPQPAKKAIRGLYGIIGVVAVVLGLALLFWPGRTLAVAAVLLGVYFVVSGVIRVVSAIVEVGLPAGWRVLDVFVGILLAIGGVAVVKNASLSGTTLLVMVTMVVGIGWIMEGVMALLESWKLPKSGWAIAYAVISVIAGLIVLFSPLSSAFWLMVVAGVALIVMGVSAVVRAFTFGRGSGAK